MTKTKAAKLIQELIQKYGDVVLSKTYDYYKERLLTPELKYINDRKDLVIKELHLSDITISNQTDYKLIEGMCRRKEIKWIPVVIEESKAEYDTEEQQELRKKSDNQFIEYMKSMGFKM